MKKLIVLAVLVGGGYLAWAKLIHTPEKRACARMADLCGNGQQTPDDAKSCADFFDTLKKSNPEEEGKTAQCFVDAKSCGEVLGCGAGGVLQMGAGFTNHFLDGLQKGLGK